MENRIEISATAAVIHRNPTFAITRNSFKVAVDLLTISKLVLLGGEGSEELGLLLRGLEAAMTELGGGVDELEVDCFEVLAGRGCVERLADDKGALLNSDAGALDHDPVLVDLSVVHEAAHGGNGLLGEVGLSLAGGLVTLLTDAVHLLVHLGTMEVTVLTGARNCRRNAGGVPGTNASNLAETAVGLAWEASDAPTGGDALVAMTLGDAEDVEVLVLGEDGVNGNLLLEECLGKVDLRLGIGAAVDLDLHDVGLFEAEVQLLGLGVGDDAHNRAELGDAVELVFNVLSAILAVLLSVLCECLLL